MTTKAIDDEKPVMIVTRTHPILLAWGVSLILAGIVLSLILLVLDQSDSFNWVLVALIFISGVFNIIVSIVRPLEEHWIVPPHSRQIWDHMQNNAKNR